MSSKQRRSSTSSNRSLPADDYTALQIARQASGGDWAAADGVDDEDGLSHGFRPHLSEREDDETQLTQMLGGGSGLGAREEDQDDEETQLTQRLRKPQGLSMGAVKERLGPYVEGDGMGEEEEPQLLEATPLPREEREPKGKRAAGGEAQWVAAKRAKGELPAATSSTKADPRARARQALPSPPVDDDASGPQRPPSHYCRPPSAPKALYLSPLTRAPGRSQHVLRQASREAETGLGSCTPEQLKQLLGAEDRRAVKELEWKWKKCLGEEWEKDGKELVDRFATLMGDIVEHISDAMELFGNMHSRLQDENKHLAKQGELIAERKETVQSGARAAVRESGKGN